MEKRKLNVSFSKSGSGSITTRLNIPKTWLEKINVIATEREVDLIFDEEKQEIILKKHNK